LFYSAGSCAAVCFDFGFGLIDFRCIGVLALILYLVVWRLLFIITQLPPDERVFMSL
jgi:hypothetical protein